ncbi:hypothetical protein SS50377_23766 [Spironucleus salmonicida]|uniref:Uncharacterized protein n=1 Tax=Spironucleus salmonicida TaxID=348837 RepID=V6LPB1_9EUKA|nr:hypothetical protein SS50377_23766 [Spironucleus salmonicida]|eukprot:EST46445.1 hypothetical protein SS50377_13529 [Spironucleus salmonicida]
MHQELISVLNESFDNIIQQGFSQIKDYFNQRQLHVMFETSLNCNPKTDHLMPKNVFPIFKDLLEQTFKQTQIRLIQSASDSIREIVTLDQVLLPPLPDNEFLLTLLTQSKRAHQDAIKQFSDEKGKLLVQVSDLKQQIYSMWKSGMCYAPDFMEDFFQKSDKDDKLQLKVKNLLSQQHTKEKSRMAKLRKHVIQQEQEFVGNISDLGVLEIIQVQASLNESNKVLDDAEQQVDTFNVNFVKDFKDLESKEQKLQREIAQIQARARDLQIDLTQSQQLIAFLKSKVPSEDWDNLIREQKDLIDNADKQRKALDSLYSQDSKLSFELQDIYFKKKDMINQDFAEQKNNLLDDTESIVNGHNERVRQLLQDPSSMNVNQIQQLQKEYQNLFDNNGDMQIEIQKMKDQCEGYLSQITDLETSQIKLSETTKVKSSKGGKESKESNHKDKKKEILDTGVPKGKKKITPKLDMKATTDSADPSSKNNNQKHKESGSLGIFSPQSATRNKYLETAGCKIQTQTDLSLMHVTNQMIQQAAQQQLDEFELDEITGQYKNKVTGQIISKEEFEKLQTYIKEQLLNNYSPVTKNSVIDLDDFASSQTTFTKQNSLQQSSETHVLSQKQQASKLDQKQEFDFDPSTGSYVDQKTGLIYSKEEYQRIQAEQQTVDIQLLKQQEISRLKKEFENKFTYDPETGTYTNIETGEQLSKDEYKSLLQLNEIQNLETVNQLSEHDIKNLQGSLSDNQASNTIDTEYNNIYNNKKLLKGQTNQTQKYQQKYEDFEFNPETGDYINRNTGETISKQEYSQNNKKVPNSPLSKNSVEEQIFTLFGLKYNIQDSPYSFLLNNNLLPNHTIDIRSYISQLKSKNNNISEFEQENQQFQTNINTINEAFNVAKNALYAKNFGVQVVYGQMNDGDVENIEGNELNTRQDTSIKRHLTVKPNGNQFLTNYYKDVPGANVYEKLFNSAKVLKERQQERMFKYGVNLQQKLASQLEKQLTESVVFGQKFFYEMEFQDSEEASQLTMSAQEIMKAEGQQRMEMLKSKILDSDLKISQGMSVITQQKPQLVNKQLLSLDDLQQNWRENIQSSSVLYLAERQLTKSHLTKSTYKFLLEMPGDTYKNFIKTQMQQKPESFKGYLNKSSAGINPDSTLLQSSQGTRTTDVHSMRIGKNLPVISPVSHSKFPRKGISNLEIRNYQKQNIFK